MNNIDLAGCLVDLDKALGSLYMDFDYIDKVFKSFARKNHNGIHVWSQDESTRYIDSRLVDCHTIHHAIPLLWRIFTSGGYFPFSAPATASGEIEIEYESILGN